MIRKNDPTYSNYPPLSDAPLDATLGEAGSTMIGCIKEITKDYKIKLFLSPYKE